VFSKFVQAAKRSGYAIIGLEQTSESVPLQELHFERRSVLLLGKELEGIPAMFMPVLDTCVEIPQFGMLRSLNVHVSGAIAMYEYTRQGLVIDEAQGMQRQGTGVSLPAA
jgi:tRNA guanosine-2'-O-methyltransferase